jgi:NhaP-type Na+/H+ or K+/H+ antiporter
MHEAILDKLILIVVLGIGAQWLAWRLRLPSILLLLVCGFVAGPVTGVIQPDALIGPALMPLVSVSVGLIMFEGGLTLKFRELREAGVVIRRLVTLGALVTWAVVAIGAHFCFAWPYQQSVLIGAILVVTGPTVVLPLLRYVQPSRATASALKWEGILIDPIGALMALLVFEAIVAQNLSDVPLMALAAFAKTLVLGTALGLMGAAGLAWFLHRHWIPDFLENAMSLMIVVGVFALSNHFQPESGLLTVTLMGVALANQRFVPIQQIVEFKETLRVLLISILFIVLAARIQPGQLRALDWGSGALFLTIILLVARPLSVWLCCLGSGFKWQEKLFLGWMAPRGIVAAAVTSLFAFRMEEAGFPQAAELVPVVFLVIVGTVAIYGLTALPVARALGVSRPNPQGILFVGAGPLARALAAAVQHEGHAVLLADTNPENLSAARMAGLPVYAGSAISDEALDEMDLTGIGRLFALTPNAEVNSLAALHFSPALGKANVFHLPPARTGQAAGVKRSGAVELKGRRLFGREVTHDELNDRLDAGHVVKSTRLTAEFNFEAFQKQHPGALALLVRTEANELAVVTADGPVKPRAGQTAIALVPPAAGASAAPPDNSTNPSLEA